jgi:DHA1 family bicyclomycin/chloramphenicol resistance-like MFS transporter
LREIGLTYRLIARDRAFLPLALAGSLNFNALWVYISSAPAFVLDLLRLDAQHFAWLFVPAISGMMFGAFLSGRVAGRLTPGMTVGLGYAIMLAASALNVLMTVLLPQPMVPWSVIPIGLHAIGIGMNFPTLTLLLLDRFPKHRGAVSSIQAFISLVISATIAGVLAPVLSMHASWLAAAALVSTVLGFGAWIQFRRILRTAAVGMA